MAESLKASILFCICIDFLYSLACWWTFRSLPHAGHHEWCWKECGRAIKKVFNTLLWVCMTRVSVPVEANCGFPELNSGFQAYTGCDCLLSHLAGQGVQFFHMDAQSRITRFCVLWLKDEISLPKAPVLTAWTPAGDMLLRLDPENAYSKLHGILKRWGLSHSVLQSLCSFVCIQMTPDWSSLNTVLHGVLLWKYYKPIHEQEALIY